MAEISTLRVTEAAGVGRVSSAVHDWYFDVDRLATSSSHDVLEVPFWRGRERQHWWGTTTRGPAEPLPPPAATLVISNVVAVRIEDEAQIGLPDVTAIRFDQSAGELVIRSSFPVRVFVRVSDLDLTLSVGAS